MFKLPTSFVWNVIQSFSTCRSLLWMLVAVMLSAGFAQATQALEFRKVSGLEGCKAGQCILASGPIDENAVDAFKAFVRTNRVGRGDVIFLDSPGGLTMAGMALGSAIREARLSTTVAAFDRDGVKSNGKCTSACVFAFLGGVDRKVASGAQLGVHQMTVYGGAQMSAADAQYFTSLICKHVAKMGGTIGVITAALGTPPQSMHIFSRAELIRNDLVTPDIVQSRVQVDAPAFVLASSTDIATRLGL